MSQVEKPLGINGETFEAYQYEEEWDGDVLTVWAKIRTTEEALERLWAIRARSGDDRYFPVVLQGQEDTRAMRFGRVLWAEDGEGIATSIVLVDEAYDSRFTKRQEGGPERSAVRSLALETRLALEGLANLLVAKGVVDRSDIDVLWERAKDGSSARQRSLYKVDDLEEWDVEPPAS